MDRLANGNLASEAEPNRQAQQKTLDALNGRRDLAVRLSTVENPRRMLAVFYALLYRAELSRPEARWAGAGAHVSQGDAITR